MAKVSEVMKGAPEAVLDVVDGIATRDMDRVLNGLTPDAQWTLVGRPDRFALGGTKPAAETVEMLRGALPAFHQFLFEVEAWAQNGDCIFVEAITRAVGPGTATYNNRYLMRFKLQNSRVAEVLEHYDPFEALVWIEQAEAQ
ncbi:MAG: nuclear transport factor 2 family protein [Novosphingobium sp.]